MGIEMETKSAGDGIDIKIYGLQQAQRDLEEGVSPYPGQEKF